MSFIEINKRYSELADSSCCLSCGGAINFAEPKPGETCIDLGSGRGTDVLRMAEQVGPTGFVYGIDISEGMLEKAKMNTKKFGVSNVRFLCKELEKIELPSETADLIISNCTINHAKDKLAVWSEIFRLLKNGGRFVVSDIYAVEPIPEHYRNDPVAIAECWAGSSTRREYLDTLKKAGFSKIEILEESAPYLKGKAEIASFTIAGTKQKDSCCCCS